MSSIIYPALAQTNPYSKSDPVLDLDRVVADLATARLGWRSAQHKSGEPGGRELPSRDGMARIVEGLRGALYPMRLGPHNLRQEHENYYVGHTLDTVLHELRIKPGWN